MSQTVRDAPVQHTEVRRWEEVLDPRGSEVKPRPPEGAEQNPIHFLLL